MLQDVPVYDPEQGVYRDITEMGPIVQWQAFGSIIRTVAIGAILGGDSWAVQDGPDIHRNLRGHHTGLLGEQGEEYVEGKGWYEWPLYHIPIFMAISLVAITVIFVIGGTLCCLR